MTPSIYELWSNLKLNHNLPYGQTWGESLQVKGCKLENPTITLNLRKSARDEGVYWTFPRAICYLASLVQASSTRAHIRTLAVRVVTRISSREYVLHVTVKCRKGTSGSLTKCTVYLQKLDSIFNVACWMCNANQF